MLRLRSEAEVRCPPPLPLPAEEAEAEASECKPMESPCLFNLREDPCERVNLALARPQVGSVVKRNSLRDTVT